MRKRDFVNDTGHPCDVYNVTENIWFYVEPEGLHVLSGPSVVTDQGHISWAQIKKALADHEAAPSRMKA